MQTFDHFSPDSLDEALDLMARLNGKGQVIAGGTDLLLKMRAGDSAPQTVINIKRIPELKGIKFDETGGLRLGALTTLRELTRSSLINEHYPCLADAAGLMASEQIRSFATLGGNLCNAAPSADLAPPLIALDGSVTVVSSSGERQMSVEAFFLGPGQSALNPGELLKEIWVPPPIGETIYLKHAPRAYMDIAVVGVAMRLLAEDGVCRQSRIVLGAVAPVPLRVHEAELLLNGQKLTKGRIQEAAEAAAEASSPIDDLRGSAWYRRRLVQVLTRRGLETLNGQ